MINCHYYFLKKLLNRILFTTFKKLLEAHSEPLHDDCRRLFPRKDIKNTGNRFSNQNSHDVVLSDEASGKSYLWRPFEFLDCNLLFGNFIFGFVNLSIGAFSYALEKSILVI